MVEFVVFVAVALNVAFGPHNLFAQAAAVLVHLLVGVDWLHVSAVVWDVFKAVAEVIAVVEALRKALTWTGSHFARPATREVEEERTEALETELAELEVAEEVEEN